MALTSQGLAQGLKSIGTRIQAVADALNELDGKIGDGDLGVSMVLCGQRVTEAAANLPEDRGMAFVKCAQAVTKGSGASFPTLVAGALLAIAKIVKGRTSLPWSETTDLLRCAEESMIKRGKAALGDKTVIDTIEAARKAALGLEDPDDILKAALTAVKQAIEQMRNRPSMVGRARIWAEKSIGLADPGMVAFERILEGLRPSKAD